MTDGRLATSPLLPGVVLVVGAAHLDLLRQPFGRPLLALITEAAIRTSGSAQSKMDRQSCPPLQDVVGAVVCRGAGPLLNQFANCPALRRSSQNFSAPPTKGWAHKKAASPTATGAVKQRRLWNRQLPAGGGRQPKTVTGSSPTQWRGSWVQPGAVCGRGHSSRSPSSPPQGRQSRTL